MLDAMALVRGAWQFGSRYVFAANLLVTQYFCSYWHQVHIVSPKDVQPVDESQCGLGGNHGGPT